MKRNINFLVFFLLFSPTLTFAALISETESAKLVAVNHAGNLCVGRIDMSTDELLVLNKSSISSSELRKALRDSDYINTLGYYIGYTSSALVLHFPTYYIANLIGRNPSIQIAPYARFAAVMVALGQVFGVGKERILRGEKLSQLQSTGMHKISDKDLEKMSIEISNAKVKSSATQCRPDMFTKYQLSMTSS